MTVKDVAKAGVGLIWITVLWGTVFAAAAVHFAVSVHREHQ